MQIFYAGKLKVEVLSSPKFKGQSVKFSLEIITN